MGLLVVVGCGIGAAVATLALRGAGVLDLPLGALTARDLAPALKAGPATLSAGIALISVLLACIPPILRRLRADVSRTLAGRGADSLRRRTRTGLLAGTVAGATVLAIMAALFLGSVRAAFNVNPGFPAAEVIFVEVLTRTSLAESDEMWSEHARRQHIGAQVLERQLKSLTGIEAVALGRSTIGRDYERQLVAPRTIRTDGGEVSVRCVVATVGAGYVEAIGLTVSAGRGFQSADGAPAAMVSRGLASILFPGGDAVGQTIWLGSALHVVGVFEDVAFGDMRAGPVNAVLVSQPPDRLTQGTTLSWALRSPSAGSLREEVAELVQQTFPDAALRSVTTAQDLIGEDIADLRLGAWLFSTYAAASLGVAAIGVWALVAFVVDSRRRELGIRLALGMSAWRMQAMLLQAALVPTFAGVGLGLFGALIVQRLLGSWLSGVAVEGPEWYVAGVCAVVVAAGVSALLGSRRALRLPAGTDL